MKFSLKVILLSFFFINQGYSQECLRLETNLRSTSTTHLYHPSPVPSSSEVKSSPIDLLEKNVRVSSSQKFTSLVVITALVVFPLVHPAMFLNPFDPVFPEAPQKSHGFQKRKKQHVTQLAKYQKNPKHIYNRYNSGYSSKKNRNR